MEENKKQDMGTCNVKKMFAKLAIPAVVAQVINLLYNVVDRVYIGRIPGVGANALTGVGVFMPIMMLITAFAMMIGSGGAPLAAIAMGQGDNKAAEKTMGNCFTMLLGLTVVLTAGFYFSAPTLLRWFGASEATLPYALTYGRIYILGTFFILIVMGMNLFISTQGFAMLSMMTTVIGAVINIVLDPILIFGFKMGVAGAAVATVLSQAVSAVWVLVFLFGRKTTLRLRKENMRLESKTVTPILSLGISTFVMLSTESLLVISFNSSLSRFGGDLAVGAMTIISSIAQLINLPLSGMCHGCQPLISYNYGAGLKSRVKEAFYTLFTTGVVYAGGFFLLVMLAPRAFASIFTTDAELIGYTAWAIRIYMAGIFALGFQITCQQSFMALGQAKISLVMACLRKLILLIPLIFILPMFMENKVLAVFLAEPISDIIASAVTTVMFFTRFDKILDHGVKKEA